MCGDGGGFNSSGVDTIFGAKGTKHVCQGENFSGAGSLVLSPGLSLYGCMPGACMYVDGCGCVMCVHTCVLLFFTSFPWFEKTPVAVRCHWP